MAHHRTRARIDHLNESAHLLASTSPAISRHLISQMHAVALDINLRLSEAQKQDACGACGNLMIPGWTSRTYLDKSTSNFELRRNANRKSKAKNLRLGKGGGVAAAATEKCMIHECLLCNRKTRQPLRMSTKSDSKQKEHVFSPSSASPAPGVTGATQLPPKSRPEAPTSSSMNASSRMRAKARKQGGLQALLAKKKKEDGSNGGLSTGFGLGLMDFMRSG
ncbi:MAG: hypothetical protein M1830_000339 [Pleopsidium flavum]|nr:MAG: hypothetical protein M1830_000339 [Pleopsidium flavum]